MNDTLDAEESAIIATFSSRRDAEIARDYLADHDFQTFVSADDAGGMHPQMQRPHGVKLVGLSTDAEDARTLLEEVDLTPSVPDASTSEPGPAAAAATDPSGIRGITVALIIATIVVAGLILSSIL